MNKNLYLCTINLRYLCSSVVHLRATKNMKNIAIFASGGGTNALQIIAHFQHNENVKVVCICTDNPKAGILEKVKDMPIETRIFTQEEYKNGAFLTAFLQEKEIDLIVLAGYLKMIPSELIQAFPKKIVNIHPSLLPKFGGKGMYGMNVHEAVIAAKELISGITIHLVDEIYDNGEILFQASLPVQADWTAKTLQQEVLKLEHLYFAKVIEEKLR